MAVHTALITGCAGGGPDCNQPPPLDGWITFWTPILFIGIAVVLLVASVAVYRRRQRNRVHD